MSFGKLDGALSLIFDLGHLDYTLFFEGFQIHEILNID